MRQWVFWEVILTLREVNVHFQNLPPEKLTVPFGKSHKNQTRPLSVIDMNKKLTIALPLLAFLVFGLVGQTLAQTRLPGVHQEDYFIYDITSHWSSSNASLSVPPYLLGINDTRWYNVTVSGVQGINVTARTAQHFANGTDDNRLITLDVDSGSIYFMYGFQGFFDANLTVGELLRPSGNSTVTINQTISRDYVSGKRDTNVVAISYPITDSTNSSIGTATVCLPVPLPKRSPSAPARPLALSGGANDLEAEARRYPPDQGRHLPRPFAGQPLGLC